MMKLIETEAYRIAFGAYLRWGTPIRLSEKDLLASDRYVWRTRRDGRVRRSHRLNDGRIFSRSEPPETGHPGEGWNCRCEAVPYIEGRTEFAHFDVVTDTADTAPRWRDTKFVEHFFLGGGRGVTLTEIGHLREFVEQYAYNDGNEGAFRRLADQIADAARNGALPYDFRHAYRFKWVEFSHGMATVRGEFNGAVEVTGNMMAINGLATFVFEDRFTDPLDMREIVAVARGTPGYLWHVLQKLGQTVGLGDGPKEELAKINKDDVYGIFMALSEIGGAAYNISDTWKARFRASVLTERSNSQYRSENVASND